ncbi:hypothetical protein ACFE04_006990 [Oxalis oulophora]
MVVIEMAIKGASCSATTTKLSLPSTSSKNKLHFNKPSVLFLPTTISISMLSLFTVPPLEAKAITIAKDQIVSSLTEVEKTIDQVQEVGSGLFDTTLKVFETLSEALKPAMDVAMPLAQQAGEQALKIASPAISEASKKVQEAGFDTEPVITTAKIVADAAKQGTKVIDVAKPIASSTFETLSSNPVLIVEASGALFLVYLLFPTIWSAISFGFRGYKGDLTPAQTLDLISTQNYIMIDIRSEKEKDKTGVPRLPSSAKNKMISIPLEELPSKLRGLVKNVKKVESELAAIKISYLKKINKGSNIVILDSYADSAKQVAKTLTSLGFQNTWIVSDGFSGRNGWLQSRLGTDSYSFKFAELLSPSRIIPAATTRFGTTTSRKLLPGD